MKKLKTGVIGTGHLGKLHIKMLKQIHECELVGIYDVNTQKAELAAKEYDVKQFKDLNELLNSVESVSIAATTTAHHELAVKCLNNDLHIFIEKPITATIREAEDLVNLANEKRLTLQVGHIERFNPALLSVEKYITQPMFIQTDRLAQFNPRGTDVAVVLDLMIHDIDIILSLIKSPVIQVDANGVAVVSDTIDIANARLKFENGAVANVTASRISQKKMRKMRLFQKDNYISLDFVTGAAEVFRLLPVSDNPPAASISFGEIGLGEKRKSVVYEQPEIPEINSLKYELQLFIDTSLKNEKPVVSGEDGLRALKIAEDIISSIENSKM